MSSLQTWLDALPRRPVDFGRGATLDLRHKANTAAAALATGWGYWFIVPPLAGARRIRNDVWREFVKANLKPTLDNYAYRRALFESLRLQPQLLFPISLRYAAVPGANYALRFTLLDMTYPQLPRDSKSQRFAATWLVTIACFTLADMPFLWMNRVIRDSRPLELLLRQEGRATNIVNLYRELKSRNQIHGLFDGWRRTFSRGMYLWGPANAVHEVAKTHWSGGPDSFFNQFFGALYGSFIGSFLYGTREFLFVRPVKEWTATDFSDSVVYKTRGIPLRGIYGWRYKTQGMTNFEIISQILGGFKLQSRPWAMTLQLVLFDQLQAISRKKDWGVRAWHWPYATFPDGMRRLHEAFPSLPRPPPLLPPTPPAT